MNKIVIYFPDEKMGNEGFIADLMVDDETVRTLVGESLEDVFEEIDNQRSLGFFKYLDYRSSQLNE